MNSPPLSVGSVRTETQGNRAHQPFFYVYSSSKRLAYFSLTMLRLTLRVGVSSPVSCERSWSRITNFLTCSTWAYLELTLSTHSWMSARTFSLVASDEIEVSSIPCSLAQGTISSSSSVMSATANGRRSPCMTHCET